MPKANAEDCGLCKFFSRDRGDECTMMRHVDLCGYCPMFNNKVISKILDYMDCHNEYNNEYRS